MISCRPPVSCFNTLLHTKCGLGVYAQRHCHKKDGAKHFSTTVIVFIHISYSAMAHHPHRHQLAAKPYHYQPHHCHSSLLLCHGTLPPLSPISDWLPPQASSRLSFEYRFPCQTLIQARHSNISQAKSTAPGNQHIRSSG